MKLNILRVEKREDCFVFVDDILLFPRLSSMASPFALFHSNITLALSRLFSLSDNYFTFSYFYEASTSSAAPSCLGVIPNSNGAGCLHVGQRRTTANTTQTHEINASLYTPSTGISFPLMSTFLRTLNAASTLTTRIHNVESTR